MNTDGTDPTYDDAAFDAEMEVVEALADKAMAPWNDRLSAADRARVREALVEALATHPNAQRLVTQLAKTPLVEVSGEVGDDDASRTGDPAGKTAEGDTTRGRSK